jgi:GT2 family glycosyltransferase
VTTHEAQSPDGAPSVAVVTVNYNSAHFAREFAESLRRVSYPRLQVVVVDSGSHDGSTDVLASILPGAVFLRSPENLGAAGGNNVGIAHCLDQRFDYILFLNNDTVVTDDFLGKLVAAADGKTMVVPKILYYYDSSLISTHAGDFDWGRGLFKNSFHGKPDGPATSHPRDVETASFCCALVPVGAFRELGLLDERFFMYYEETDWIPKALDQGYRLRYLPAAVIYHRESGASGGGWMTPFKHYYATRNRLYLMKKHSPSRWRYALFTAHFLATRLIYIASHLAHARWGMARAMALGVLHYYRGRMGRTLEVHDL